MNRVTKLNLKRVFALAPVAMLGVTSLLTFNGCSSTTPTEPSSGGTNATGATGGTGTAGTPGTGGTTSSAGATSSAGTGSMVPFPTVPNCPNVAGQISTSCAKIGCHKNPFAAADLDLTPNTGFVGRVKDVVATHAGITCPGGDGGLTDCIPATCPTGAKLIDSSNAANSWMTQKLENMVNGCGTIMPAPPDSIDAATKSCIEALVQTVAAMPK